MAIYFQRALMRKALITGGGSKNAVTMLDCLLEHSFCIDNFGSSVYERPNIVNHRLDWKTVDIEFVHKNFSNLDGSYDLVFFNHNSSSLNSNDFCLAHDDTLETWKRVKDWSHSHWLSCQMPFLILHTMRRNLHRGSKIGWMLSTCIDHKHDRSALFPDYSGYKFFNYLAMKSFGSTNNLKTFGIFPDFSQSDSELRLKKVMHDIITNHNPDQDCFWV